jgi:putative transposase
MNFKADQTFAGRELRIPTIVDAANLLRPAVDVRATCRGADVIETLERVNAIHGRNKQTWMRPRRRAHLKRHEPVDPESRCADGLLDVGQADDNTFIEAVNGRFRPECL